MDVRTDDFIAEVTIRSENSQEMKSIEIFAHTFSVQDGTGDVDFADDQTRADLLAQVERDILRVAGSELDRLRDIPVAAE